MPVIAMTQEMATLGKDVALGVCEALGVAQVRHEVGDIVAGRMQVKKSLIRRLREGKASTMERWGADEKTISIFTAEEVLDRAVAGNVLIRGWGATLWLRPVSHIAGIQVCAPMPLRIERLMARLDTDDEALATREILADDAARAARMEEHFGVHWGNPTLYDLTLNTERTPISDCIDLVLKLVSSAAFQETDASRQCLRDQALAAKVRAAFRAQPDTVEVDVAVTATSGNILLEGIVANAVARERSAEIAGAVAGVSRVENKLNIMSGGVGRRIFPSGLTR